MPHFHAKAVSSQTAEQGFTLIELMVTVAIIAIIAAVAIPSYRNHVIKTNRGAAEAFMLQIANKEEQYMLDARQYTANWGAGGLNLSAPTGVSVNYTITIPVVTATGYTIKAVPINPPQNDALCGTLTLDQTGAKTSSAGTVGVCWQ